MVVEERVNEYKDAGGSGAQDAPPPPAVVLAREQEVGEGHRDASAHREQNSKDAEQDTVQRVVFTAPNGGKDVVQFYRYGTVKETKQHQTIIILVKIISSTAYIYRLPKRQEPSDGHVHGRVFVPRLPGDLTGYVACAARRLEVACFVLSDDSTDDGEREAHQHPGT